MNRSLYVCAITLLSLPLGMRAQTSQIAEVRADYQAIRDNLLKAAEKMPETGYSFKPVPEIRDFGQLIAHVADAQTGICAAAKGDAKRGDAASKTSKADLVAALKASSASCDAIYGSITDSEANATIKSPRGDMSKLGVLIFNLAHDNEMYGTIAVYLRLKGIVPPSTSDTPPPAR